VVSKLYAVRGMALVLLVRRKSDAGLFLRADVLGTGGRGLGDLHVEPNQKISDLKFRLGRPQTPRQITVVVAGPDGKPPGDHLLQVFANEELLRNLGGLNKARSLTTTGRLIFTGYEERQYRLSARYWVNDLGDGAPVSEELIGTTGVSIVGPVPDRSSCARFWVHQNYPITSFLCGGSCALSPACSNRA
jgi:hypothetical protein